MQETKFERPKGTVVYTREEERQILNQAYEELRQNPEMARELMRKAGILDENGELTPKYRETAEVQP